MKEKREVSTDTRMWASEDRLDSWKEISSFLARDVRTVQRWERHEGLPVHRHGHEKGSSVYAFKSEVDAWKRSRRTEKRRHSRADLGLCPFLPGSLDWTEQVLLRKLLTVLLAQLNVQTASSASIVMTQEFRSPSNSATRLEDAVR